MTQAVSAAQLRTIGAQLAKTGDDLASFSAQVVNQPFRRYPLAMAELFLGFICMYVVDGEALRFMGASDTEYYHLAVKDYPFDADNFAFPMSDRNNNLVQAILENKPIHVADWDNVRSRKSVLETVRLNQASSAASP